ncbi:YitT family protein [Ruminococcaceae bacterium OttesenSCG-928-A16]|nr:YitT family protein [Ruminococcaceae bacterium OttesenSCG-928-A16]
MKKTWDWKTFLVDTLYYMGGSVLYALALQTFAVNAKFAPGGISGLSIILNHYTGWPIGVVSLLLNIPIVLVCWRILGHKFLLKSIWAMIINAFFLDIVFQYLPAYNGNPLLASMFTGVFLGAGLAVIYMRGSSTGGSDFIIMSVKKLRPHFSVGQISLAFDAIVILAGGLVFGNVDAVLYGIISSFACTLTMDNVLYGAGSGKLAIIITNHGQKIADAISAEVDRGSTLVKATGTYTGQEREMLYCACGKNEIYKVRTAARAVDPDALVMVTEASEVIGEGFVPPNIPGNEPPAQRPNTNGDT